jgi:pyrroloquinoline quinone biosynthesis protein B
MQIIVLAPRVAVVSADGHRWVLLNAPPDIARQLCNHPRLRARPELARGTPVQAVVLLDAQIDHVIGLLGLRDGPALDVHATPSVFEDLTTGLPVLNVLQHYCGTRWHMVPVAGEHLRAEFRIGGFPSLRFTALAVPGRSPPYSSHRREHGAGDKIALLVEDLRDGRRVMVDDKFWEEEGEALEATP